MTKSKQKKYTNIRKSETETVSIVESSSWENSRNWSSNKYEFSLKRNLISVERFVKNFADHIAALRWLIIVVVDCRRHCWRIFTIIFYEPTQEQEISIKYVYYNNLTIKCYVTTEETLTMEESFSSFMNDNGALSIKIS